MKGPARQRRLLTFALLGLCAVLAVLALVPPPPAAMPERTDQVTIAPLDTDDSAGSVIKMRGRNGPAFRRPIFVPSRRLAADNGKAPAKTAKIDSMKLKAVFLGPDVKKAFVTTAQAPNGLWLNTGQSLGGWRVREIQPEILVLAGPGGHQEIELEKPEAEPPGRRSMKMRDINVPTPPSEDGEQDTPKEESAQNEPEPD